jgi:hypothetical protein
LRTGARLAGWAPASARVFDTAGRLSLVKRDRKAIPTYDTEAEQQQFYQQLLGIAEARGYKPAFADYKFLERFPGTKPPQAWRSLAPLDPEPHVWTWVQSRLIAYAKAQARGGMSAGFGGRR